MTAVWNLRFVAAAVALLSSSTAAEPQTQGTVRIAGAAYVGDLPTHVADARGLFAGQGLDAVVDYSESGKRNMARLRAGETDFALMALTPLVLDRLADPDPGGPDDPVILASLLQSHELTVIFAAPDSGIDRPADLGGHRVAIERGTNTEFVWWLFEQFHDIDPASVEVVSIPFAETPEAVASGRVDAAVLPEPWASRLEARLQATGRSPVRRFNTRNLYAGRWVLVTTRRHVLQRREACRKLLAAYREAIEFIERAPADAISIYAENTGATDSILAERWEALDYDLNLDWALIASLQEQLRWIRDVGKPDAGAPLRVLELLETGPLREVRADAVKIPAPALRDGIP